jgi:hypothetical protein
LLAVPCTSYEHFLGKDKKGCKMYQNKNKIYCDRFAQGIAGQQLAGQWTA